MIHAISVTETDEIITINTVGHMVSLEDMDVMVTAVVEGMCKILFYLIKKPNIHGYFIRKRNNLKILLLLAIRIDDKDFEKFTVCSKCLRIEI